MEQKFWSKVNRGNPNDCWLWTAGTKDNGYGQCQIEGKKAYPHRVAYELHHNIKISVGLVVRHTCDIRTCCNPNHLELGTQADNIYDMVMRDRQTRGEQQHSSKLTDDQVREIKRQLQACARGTQAALAREFGVSHPTIQRIANGTSWKHVNLEKL